MLTLRNGSGGIHFVINVFSLYAFRLPGLSGLSGCSNSCLSRIRMTADMTAARREVPAKFSQIPVRPRGRDTTSSITGKTSAVDTEIRDAGSVYSMASI